MSEQRELCAREEDLILEAGAVSFGDMDKTLERRGVSLEAGDRVKIYDFNALPLNTMSLVRTLGKLLDKGVEIEFLRSEILITPDKNNEYCKLVRALDAHWRTMHGIKTHKGDGKTGRKALLTDEQLPEIQKLLAKEGATTSSVAKELNVGRTTLFDFLNRHKQENARERA